MEDKKSEQGDLNDQVFINFIEVNDKSRNFESHLVYNTGIKSSEIEIVEEKEFPFHTQFYIYKVHRIKVIKENPKFEVSVQFKEDGENDNIYERIINNIEIIKNTSYIFLYNFQPIDKNLNICFSKNSSNEFPLSYFEQFKIYLNILKEKNKSDRNSKEFQDCIKYIMNILDQIKYEFVFYMSVFAECFDTKIINQFLRNFKTEQITAFGEFSNEDLNIFKDIINKITKEPNIVLEKINPDERPEAETTLYTIILIFDLKFQKEELKLIKWDEDIFQYIFSKYFHLVKLFDFNVIKDILSLTDDCLSIVFILNMSAEFLFEKFNILLQKIKELKEERKIKEKKDIKEKDLIIQVDKYIVFKDEEKYLDKILFTIESLINFQKEKKVQFISFSPNFFEFMTKLINEKNIEQIFSLKKILKSVKQFETSSKYKKIDTDKIVDKILNHSIVQKNFEFLKNKSAKLINHLNKNDKYLDGYALELIKKNEEDIEFLENRKKEKIQHDKNFIKNACSIIKSLDQFKMLIEVLCKGKESKDFIKKSLLYIHKTFFNICKQYTNEKLMNYLNIISSLIQKSDIYLEEEKVENFLIELEKCLSKDFIVYLYINVLNQYQKLNNNIKIKINNFLENLEPKYIAILIKDLNDNNLDFIKRKLTKYIIKEEEFFILEDSNSIKVLNLLFSYGVIPKKESSNIYLKETYKKIESIGNNLKNNDYTYANISQFFLEENKQKLSERISWLYILDNKELLFYNNNKSFVTIQQALENKYKEVKNYIDTLNLYHKYLSHFIIKQNHTEYTEIMEMIFHLENCKINQINREDFSKIDKFEKKFGKKARERMKYTESLLFLYIKDNEVKSNKDDEIIIEESIKKFEQSGEIFKKDGFDTINKNVLTIYIDFYTNKNKKEICEELEKIMNILSIKPQGVSIDEIANTLSLFCKKDYVLNVTEALKNFIDQTEVIQKEYTGTINSIIEFKENIYNKDFLKMSIEILEALGLDLKNEDNYFINIILCLRREPEVIKFLLGKNVEECGLLYDALDNNEFLKISDIIDLEKCVEYMNSLGNEDELKEMKDYELIEKAKSSNLMSKNLEINFINFINHFDDIKEIIKETFDKSEASRQKISYISKNSTFCLSTIAKNFFEGKYFINDGETINNNKIINLNELQELRDRAILTINPLGETNENKIFIDMVSDILKVYNLLSEIYYCGYTKKITIRITTNKTIRSFEITSPENYIGKYENVESILTILKNIINNLKSNYKLGYQKKIFLRFIYGRQFNIIYDYLNKIKDNISPFLKFITNNELKNIKVNYKLNEDETKNEFQNIIDNGNNFIKKILDDNKLSLKEIYNKTLIKKKLKTETEDFKGFYVYSCTKVEKEIIQLYIFLTENAPIAQNILLCNKKTLNEEITSFLYRAVLCEYNSCFIIGGIESLKFNQKNYFIEILNQILNEVKGKMESCLIILSSVKSSDIYKSLDSIKYKKTFNSSIEKNIEKIKLDKIDRISIFTSDKAGIGKSTKIKNMIIDKKKIYKYFPLGGVFTRNDILKRLKELKIAKNTIIHLDLYDTDCIDLMMEFLFWILIAKMYKVKEDIFFLLEDTEIYIEIPNGFIDFFGKFPILDLIPQKPENKLLINKLEPLIVPKEIDSKVQIVSNYLKLLKDNEIDKYDLNIDGITTDFIKNSNKNIKNAIVLSQNECQKLIFEKFKEANSDLKYFNYYQIQSFIDVLSDEFIKFNHSFYISTKILRVKQLRPTIIEGFIKLSNYFTQGAYTKLINEQKIVHKKLFGQYDENEDYKNGINNLAKDKHFVVSFDKIDPSLIFFHEGESPLFSYITNKNPDDIEYKRFLALFNSQDSTKIEKFPDYKDKKFNFLPELKAILGINNPLTNKEKTQDQIKDKIKSLEEIAFDYAFTSDNYIKIILILLRLRANIPVIMMGETGCGKTALIKKLSELKNNGERNQMKILNIHAGTTDDDIIKFIEEIIPHAEALELIENQNKEKSAKEGFLYEKKKIWVFLDEINTCKSMGLISELMCKHTYQGKSISPNIVFIGACNPYREAKQNGVKIGLKISQAHYNIDKLNEKQKIQIKKRANNKLVYNVNPLPHSLLNFVYDFASLEEKDEKKYISKIIKPSFKKIFKNYKEDKINYKRIKTLAKDMIFEAQKFIRDNYDKSSVSLREVKRYNVFFEFFFYYLKDKKEKLNYLVNEKSIKFEYGKLTEFDLQEYAINLAIFICYYIRISDKKLRENLSDKLSVIFKKDRSFLDLPLLEMKFITDNIDIPRGIAINKALSENLFSLFCAINTRIPLFIVGKPGCSKSLSVQLILKSMKGSSENEFFKKYFSKLVVFSYQGSLSSTSEGVETIFNKANNSIKKFKAENKDNIPMIFFDEMGLAEHSPNNPLKVIHSKLEITSDEEKESKAAFVGISNWVLDAAKMNRGLHISIPELDEEDIINTAKTIAKSYNEELISKFSNYFENLGKTYYNYKQYLKENHYLDGKEDFHGNRDFFHFIKYASKIISKKINTITEKGLFFIGFKSIERNFAGLELGQKDSVTIVKEIFKEKCNYNNINFREYNSIKNIKENKIEDNSRYLLLISNSSESFYLLSSILEEDDYIFFIGSPFIEDFNSEEYQLKVIKKIQIYMEEGKTIILKDLESVYPALYDLFNQNFTVMNGKNFARISIGSSFSIYSLVNKKFKCIVNVDRNDINKQEPPFLNRFEKHIIAYENLLNKDLTEIAKNIFDDFNIIINSKKKFIIDNYDFEKILVNLNLEEIKGMVYKVSKYEKDENKIIKEVLSKIALILPQDAIFQIKYNCNIRNRDLIFEYYLKGEHLNLENFFKKMNSRKNVIYTFSKILDKINIREEIQNDNLKFRINSFDNIKIIKLGGIKSEKEYEKNIEEFFNDDKFKICLIHFSPEESNFINYTKFFIENKEKEYQNNSKIFILIVHIFRIFNYEFKNLDKNDKKYQEILNKKCLKQTISNLSDYYQIFIDNLNGDIEPTLDTIIPLKGDEIFENFLKLDKELDNNIYSSLSYLKYNIYFPFGNINKINYKDNLIQLIKNDKDIRKKINHYINKHLLEYKNSIRNTFENDEGGEIQIEIYEKDIDIISILKNYLSNLYKTYLVQIIFKLEKVSYFSSLILTNQKESFFEDINGSNMEFNNKKKIISQFSELIFENFSREEIKITEKINSNIVNIILGLEIPGIKIVFEDIEKKINENISKFRINEFNLRIRKKDSEDSKENIENDYWKELKKYCNFTVIEIKNEIFISKIINILKEEEINLFYEILINDYYIFFINNNLNFNSISINMVSIKKMLSLLIKIRNQKYGIQIKEQKEQNEEEIKLNNKNKLKEIANTINWIECYKEEIIIILKIYAKLDLKINNLYELIKDIIEGKKFNIKYENSVRNPQYTAIVNEIIFLGIESLLKILISNEKLFDDINDVQKLIELINYYREILQDISKLQNNLMLYSKEMHSLEEIVEIFDLFYINKINKKEYFSEILKCFSNETELINNKEEEEYTSKLKINFDQLYKTLFKHIKKDKNFPKLMSIIFYNEFKKIDNKKFRIELMNIWITNDEFIYNSSNLIELILGNYLKNDCTKFKENINNIQKCELIEFLNDNCKKEILEEMLINCFEFHINLYFKEIEKRKDKNYLVKKEVDDGCGTFQIFLDSIDYLNYKNIENFSICKLYLISFIKMYLNITAYYYISSGRQYDLIGIIEKINLINIVQLRIVIKFYFYKLLFNYSTNYENFKQIPIVEDIMLPDEFKFNNKSGQDEILIYHFFPSKEEDLKKYVKQYNKFGQKLSENEPKYESFQHIKEKYGLDMLIILIFNKIISHLDYNNLEEDKLSIFSKLHLEGYLNNNIIELLSLYYDKKNFNEKIKTKLLKDGEIDQNLFIILLYGFRYCVQSLNENNLYSNLFNKNCSSIFKNYFIPGNHSQDDLHLYTLFDIEKHFNEYPSDKGCYICSCGYYYSIDPCGFPTKEQYSNCPKCKKVIGYRINNNPNKLEFCIEKREGHYRIFKSVEDKNYEMKKYNINDDMVPNISYNDYIKNIIKPILEKENSGIKIIQKDQFLSTPKKIRNLSKIGYRLLNFIIYSHLFFSNCLEFINDEELKNNFLVEDMTCLEIIEKSWNLLKEALYEKSINSIEIFMNLIFQELCKSFNECKSLKKYEERNNFEYNVEKIIAKSLEKYNNYKEIYLKENLKELELDNDYIKVIVNEMIEPQKYTKEYPLFKYFMLTKYPDKNDFMNKKKEIGDEIFRYKYPLISQYLLDESNKTKIENLFDINEFCNYMIDSYSFKILRETANETCMNDEIKDDFPQDQLDKFLKAWENIYVDVQNFKGDTTNIKKLSKNDKLIKFLNDDKDKNISSAYQYFINYQNSFLQPIYNVISLNGILHFYAHTLKNRIPIQKAKSNNILSFANINFENIIYKSSKRNILKENDKIDYFNYNSFIYDFHSIEKELGELILQGKFLFDENKLRYVSFWFEGSTDIFNNFCEIYNQIELDEEEENQLKEFFGNVNDIEEIKKILSFFQSFIYYLNNNKYEEDESIKIILENEDSFKKEEIILDFFNKHPNLKINQLLNIFLYLENFFFDKIKDSIEDNNNLAEDLDDDIDKDCLKNIIKNIDLSSPLRRYISRYLIDENYVSNNLNRNLSLELSRYELWNENETKFNEIKDILNGEFENLNLTIKDTLSLYKFINENKEDSNN